MTSWFGFSFNMGFSGGIWNMCGINNFCMPITPIMPFTPTFNFNPFNNFNFNNIFMFNNPLNSMFNPFFNSYTYGTLYNTGFDVFESSKKQSSKFSDNSETTKQNTETIPENEEKIITTNQSVSTQKEEETELYDKQDIVSNTKTNTARQINETKTLTNPTSKNQNTPYVTQEINKSESKIKKINVKIPLGYNKEKGEKLAKIALKGAEPYSIGYCAQYVKNAIENADLGKYQKGHAYKMISILSNNKNFKRISTNDFDVSTLPAGCILVYGKGVGEYSPEYGHVEITLGNGNAVSDFVQKNIYKKPSAIFMPV